MQKSNYDLLNKNKQRDNQKIPLFGRTVRLVVVVYFLWTVLSVVISLKNAQTIAAYFIDLPQGLKNLPPFIVSIAYLDFFLPAILLVIIYSIYIFAIVISNGSWKNVRVYDYIQSQSKMADPK